MNKSLAERIGEHTRQVIADREAERRARNKAIILRIVTDKIIEIADNGKQLFWMDESGSRRLTLTTFIVEDSMMRVKDITIAFGDIGFEFMRLPPYMTDGWLLCIPQENRSNEIQELLKLYDEHFHQYVVREETLAENDCAVVLKKLEEGQYEVKGIDHVVVEFEASSPSLTECYKAHVNELMKCEGFVIELQVNAWNISIQEGDD